MIDTSFSSTLIVLERRGDALLVRIVRYDQSVLDRGIGFDHMLYMMFLLYRYMIVDGCQLKDIKNTSRAHHMDITNKYHYCNINISTHPLLSGGPNNGSYNPLGNGFCNASQATELTISVTLRCRTSSSVYTPNVIDVG